jgi:hypothetical protein
LLAEVSAKQPLVCLVDDAQWLDRASAQVLAFVARRLQAESVGLVFGTRIPGGDLVGLPELVVGGLPEAEARALLDAVLAGPIDARVREQIVAETGGNPLALLELPRGFTAAELAGGFGLPGAGPLAGSIEDSFRRRVEALPAQTQRLLLVAAADPTGDAVLVWRAAGCGSGIRWSVRRCTGRLRSRTGNRRTRRWPRPPIRWPIRIGGPGTGPRPRLDRMSRSRRSWSGRPGGRRPAGGWPPPPRSLSARRR